MPKKKAPPKKLPYVGWTPMKDGVTQSLLQKFKVDKDRFHKHSVLNLRETNRKEAMEYGSIFHKLIEVGSLMGNKYTRSKILESATLLFQEKLRDTESAMLVKIAIAQYDKYRTWEKTRPQYKVLEAEPIFRENFRLPPFVFNPNDCITLRVPENTTFPLRGRIDEVLEIDGQMWIQENKTKSRIDVSFLQDTIPCNLQVMFYALCSELKYSRPCKGVIYNVIRKPQLRQKVKESDKDFITRIGEDIDAQPNHYFIRFQYEFAPNDVKKWTREELLPLLYEVFFWWKSIEANPLNPWGDEKSPNPLHGRKSFGVYDPMVDGKGEFYELIVNNKKTNLVESKELFPELKDDEE
jgi:hypothetical protein